MRPLSVAPSALKAYRRNEREAWKVYSDKRANALSAGRAYRANKIGPMMLAHEDAIHDALEARHWAWHATRELEWAESVPVEAHGGRISPAAMERLRRNGRLK